jgi:hypothetical protein
MIKVVRIRQKSKNITPVWVIDGLDGFVVATDNKMYNIITFREVRMVLNGYTKGFYLNRKFYSLARLRPLLRKIDI